MRQVIALELVGLKKLDCDLYNENGKLIYKKGTEFTPEIFMMLNHTKIFRNDEEPLICKDQEKKTISQKKPLEMQDDKQDPAKAKRDGFNELHEKEAGDYTRDGFNELHEKEPAEKAKRDGFNELQEKIPSDLKKSRDGFNELHKKEYVQYDEKLIEPQKHYQTELNRKASKTDITSVHERVCATEHTVSKTSVLFKDRIIPEKQAVEKAASSIRQLEPKNVVKEFKSVVDEEKKQVLLNGIQNVIYSAINSISMDLKPCVDATESILNEVYTRFKNVNNFNELRIHDYYTFAHSLNVAMISAILARELGFNKNKIKDLIFSAFLHDVGKMQIPKEILYKQEPLTDEEIILVKKHTELGYNYLVEKLGLPEEIAKPALEHHERWEGQGYPRGLKKDEISEFSQIIAIVDVYDALVSDKIYRGPVKSIDAMRIILNEESGSFNPQILNKFVYLGVINTGVCI